MKSAYERALEKLEEQGIERPRDEAYSDEMMDEMEEVRTKAQARVAELEILHQKELAAGLDPLAAAKSKEELRIEVERIESNRDQKLAALRKKASS